MICLSVTELSQVSYARRTAMEVAQKLGLSETEVGKVALVATELGTNLVKHASQGQLLMQGFVQNGINGVELLALDKGPGMANVMECLRDGYSTAGSSGSGLGAIVRTASLAEIYSVPGAGTVVLAQLNAASQTTLPGRYTANPGLRRPDAKLLIPNLLRWV